MTKMQLSSLPLSQGTVVILTSGAYSDYVIQGVIITLAEMNLAEEAATYLAETATEHDPLDMDYDAFIAHLMRKGLVTEFNHECIHLGCYGNYKAVRERDSQTRPESGDPQ